jgi:hypothetical protein
MSFYSSSWRRVAVYAMAATVLGGGLWFLTLVLAVPQEERFSRPWWTVAAVGTCSWLVVGIVIGAFGPKGGAKTAPSQQRPAGLWLTAAFAFLGQLFYRALVGFLVANILMGVYFVLAIAIAFLLGDHLDPLRGTSLGFALMSALGASGSGGLIGAVFGGIFAPSESARQRRTLVKSAFLGNLLGILLAGHLGAVVGTVLDFVLGQEGLHKIGEDYVLVLMAIGGGAGIIAGALCGLWCGHRAKHLSINRVPP